MDMVVMPAPAQAPVSGSISAARQYRKKRVPNNRSDLSGSNSPQEAGKMEMRGSQVKTPVSVLQECLSRRNIAPSYELIQVNGAIHEPTFSFRCTVKDVQAIGSGRSKKHAKHAAARAMCNQLQITHAEGLGNDSSSPTNDLSIVSPFDDNIPGNPVGSLQELCMCRRWPPPTYEVENEGGLPHDRQFTIACTLFKHKEIGVGRSKKIAKRIAAHNMWEKIHNIPVESDNLCTNFNVEDDQITQRVSNLASCFGDIRNSTISTMTLMENVKVSQFHKNIQSSTGPKLNELKTSPLNDPKINFAEFLRDIAKEQNIEVTYIGIEELSVTGKVQCLIQLSTLPVAVCYGCGQTSEEAQSAAAHNTLEYLKILVK